MNKASSAPAIFVYMCLSFYAGMLLLANESCLLSDELSINSREDNTANVVIGDVTLEYRN